MDRPSQEALPDAAAISASRFLLVTLAVSWALWVPLAAIRRGLLPDWVPTGSMVAIALPGVLVPSVVGVLVCARRGRAPLHDLRARATRWRVGSSWWAALALQPAVLGVAAVIVSLAGTAPSPAADLRVGTLLGTTVGLVVASFGEEVGWRGVALPALVRRQGWSRASLTLGLVVAAWHVPYWVLQGVFEDHGATYLGLDVVFVVALTYQLSWLVRLSRWSVLVAVAFHVSFNLVNVALLPLTDATGAFAVLTAVEVLLALLAARALRE